MAPCSAGPSTIFASMCFHCALKAAMPSAVNRSTTCAGTSVGASCGGDVGGSGWADTASIRDALASTAPARSVARLLWRMIIPPLLLNLIVSTLFHLLETAGAPARSHRGRGERRDEGTRMRGLLAAHRDGARIDGPELRVARQRAGHLRALDRHDLADQRDCDLGLAVCHLLGGIVATSRQHALLDHRVGDAEAVGELHQGKDCGAAEFGVGISD